MISFEDKCDIVEQCRDLEQYFIFEDDATIIFYDASLEAYNPLRITEVVER